MTAEILEKKIQQVLDIQEIEQLVNRYTWKMEGKRFEEAEDIFALKTPGVRAEMLWGVYEGAEGIRKLYSGLLRYIWDNPSHQGRMFVQCFGVSNIVVADDLKTAKLTGEYLGHETWSPQDRLQAFWTDGCYAMDCVKEDGLWKIWHYHEYGVYYTTFEKGWVEEALDHPLCPYPDEYPDIYRPDRPSTTYWMYKPDENAKLTKGTTPLPYKTFDEKTAY